MTRAERIEKAARALTWEVNGLCHGLTTLFSVEQCAMELDRALAAPAPTPSPAPRTEPLDHKAIRCPCGGGMTVMVPQCPACGETWIDVETAKSMDANTFPHVVEERRRKIEEARRGRAAPAPSEEPCPGARCEAAGLVTKDRCLLTKGHSESHRYRDCDGFDYSLSLGDAPPPSPHDVRGDWCWTCNAPAKGDCEVPAPSVEPFPGAVNQPKHNWKPRDTFTSPVCLTCGMTLLAALAIGAAWCPGTGRSPSATPNKEK